MITADQAQSASYWYTKGVMAAARAILADMRRTDKLPDINATSRRILDDFERDLFLIHGDEETTNG